MKIKMYPDSVLKVSVDQVDVEDATSSNTGKLILAMRDTMESSGGVGLAANQVGINKAIFVMRGDRYYINPKIIDRSGSITIKEGCLSFPGIRVKVNRSKKITIEHLDVEGNILTDTLEDLDAIIAQHEIDHLNGITLYDKASPIKREMIKKKLMKFKKNIHKLK